MQVCSHVCVWTSLGEAVFCSDSVCEERSYNYTMQIKVLIWYSYLISHFSSAAEAERVEGEFIKCTHFLVSFLQKTVEKGSYPHCK